jgi:hypothetical protein
LHGYCSMRFGLSRRPEGVRETAVAAQYALRDALDCVAGRKG